MKVGSKLVGWISTLIVIMAMGAPAHGEEKCSVSGIVSFSEGEVVFVSLYAQDRFNDFKNRPFLLSLIPRSLNSRRSRGRQGKRNSCLRVSPGDLWGSRVQGDQEKHEKDRSQYFKDLFRPTK